MKRLLALFAFLTFAAFVLVLIFEVPSPDLIVVSVLTISFVAYDFMTSERNRRE